MNRYFISITTALAVSSSPLVGQELFDPVFVQWHKQVDPAVERALEFLVEIQKEDGSFPEKYGDSTGIPALVGMAFLSKGHLPTEGRYADALNRCIDFILASQKENGLLEKGSGGSGPMYAHNIATLFLSEVSGMVDPERQSKIAQVLPGALKVILEAQQVEKREQHQGGWRYHPGSRDSDTSCSGWALMALRSAKLNGAAVPAKSIDDAVAYLRRHQDVKTGTFGYMKTSDHALSLTGMGLLGLELSGLHGSPESKAAADYVMKTFRNVTENKYVTYANYYNAQAMFQMGGRYWEEFAPWLYSTYLEKQRPDGSWDSRVGGRIYGTSMMVLTMTVPWRQLPIYQRDETVGE